jgi:diguanylate cyclase (GGDEF)-like protein
LLAGEIADYRFEKRYVRADGTPVWVSVFARTLEQKPGEPASLALVVEDITERRESAQRLQQLHADLERKVVERTQQLQETTRRWADRTRDLSLLADMMGALPAAVDIAEASQIVAGFLPQIFGGFAGEIWIEQGVRGVFERVAGWRLEKEGPPTLRAEDCWALRRGQPLHIEDPNDPLICRHTHDERGRQGPHACMPILALGEMIGLIHLRWTELSGMSPDQALLESTAKQIGLAIGNVRLREELSRQALRDPLTGLFNRRQFESLLQRRIASASREPGGFGILMIDVDHFKSVNDRYGHEAGDAVLKTVAEAVAQTIRPQDDVCRLGGEEFVVLLSDPAPHEIQFVAERIRARIEDLPMAFNGTTLPGVTVSIGVAIFPLDASEGSTLLRVADEAMYGAKRAGRNRICVSPRAMHPRVFAIRD